jgi:hypothetical protein
LEFKLLKAEIFDNFHSVAVFFSLFVSTFDELKLT